MRSFLLCLLLCSSSLVAFPSEEIVLKDFPQSYNPSIVEYGQGYLLSFRFHPDPELLHVSCIGLVSLDAQGHVDGAPYLLNPMTQDHTPQTEDARLFWWNDTLYVLYNDNPVREFAKENIRREMYLAPLHRQGQRWSLGEPRRLSHPKAYKTTPWQKNWTPLIWQNELRMLYTFDPYEMVTLGPGQFCLEEGQCSGVSWDYGTIRGGTPALRVADEYWGFFHSSSYRATWGSYDKPMLHYSMGMFILEGEPPFRIKKASAHPLVGQDFYEQIDFWKRVIFPGGFVIHGDEIWVAYGKDDRKICLAKIPLEQALNSLVDVDPTPNQDAAGDSPVRQDSRDGRAAHKREMG